MLILGGFEVKKTQDFKLSLILILFMLCVVAMSSLNFVSAFFTSTANISGDVNFHNVTLEVNAEEDDYPIFAQNLTSILPGDSVSFDGLTVTNSGSADVYVVLNVKVVVEKSGSTLKTDSKWYNLENEEIDVADMSNNSVGASELAASKSETLSLTYEFVGADYNDDFKGASVTVSVSAYCIQKANLEEIDGIEEDDLIAAYMLVADYNK